MDNIDIISKHFNDLNETQIKQFEMLGTLYPEWNERINVISRKDIDNLYLNHILHSLSIAKFLGPLDTSTSFLDLGTGGGFPGIPLAIYYPQSTFHLIDRIGKKLRVAEEIANSIGLKNVTYQHGDIKECKGRYNYVVSRAVMPLNELYRLILKNVLPEKKGSTNRYANGLICLKGGDLTQESKGVSRSIIDYPVNEFIPEERFVQKSLIYIPFS